MSRFICDYIWITETRCENLLLHTSCLSDALPRIPKSLPECKLGLHSSVLTAFNLQSIIVILTRVTLENVIKSTLGPSLKKEEEKKKSEQILQRSLQDVVIVTQFLSEILPFSPPLPVKCQG